jgi:FAD/FMN-containing dehydrogenase
MWHAGMGDGRIRCVGKSQQTEDKTVARLAKLRAEAQSMGSALIVENAPTKIKQRIDAWGTSVSSARLMRRVKQQLDPTETFSPGRFPY